METKALKEKTEKWRQLEDRKRATRKMIKRFLLLFVIVASIVSSVIIYAYKFAPIYFAVPTLEFGRVMPEAGLSSSVPKSPVSRVSPAPMETSNKSLFESEKVKILAMNWDKGVEIAFYIKDLKTGEVLSYNSKKMNSASMIKLFIMLEAFKSDKDGTITFTPEIKETLKKMITKSDNEASRKLTDIYYAKNVETLNLMVGDMKNVGLLITPISYTDKGFPDTIMERKMHDKLPPDGSSGKNNWTSVEDVGILLEQIYNKECVSKQASEEMLLLLRQQERVNKIPKLIREKQLPVTVANKTGELNQVENDAAIITGTGIDNFIFVIMINNIPYDESNKQQSIKIKKEITDNIAQIAVNLVRFFEKN